MEERKQDETDKEKISSGEQNPGKSLSGKGTARTLSQGRDYPEEQDEIRAKEKEFHDKDREADLYYVKKRDTEGLTKEDPKRRRRSINEDEDIHGRFVNHTQDREEGNRRSGSDTQGNRY